MSTTKCAICHKRPPFIHLHLRHFFFFFCIVRVGLSNSFCLLLRIIAAFFTKLYFSRVPLPTTLFEYYVTFFGAFPFNVFFPHSFIILIECSQDIYNVQGSLYYYFFTTTIIIIQRFFSFNTLSNHILLTHCLYRFQMLNLSYE